MNFIKTQDIKKDGYTGKQYYADAPIGIDDIIEILSSYNNNQTSLYICNCDTFNDNGSPRVYGLRGIDQLKRMHSFPNPSIGVHAIYIDRKTHEYKFDISTAVNTRIIEYRVSDRVNSYVKRRMELDRMEREAAEKRKQEAKKNK